MIYITYVLSQVVHFWLLVHLSRKTFKRNPKFILLLNIDVWECRMEPTCYNHIYCSSYLVVISRITFNIFIQIQTKFWLQYMFSSSAGDLKNLKKVEKLQFLIFSRKSKTLKIQNTSARQIIRILISNFFILKKHDNFQFYKKIFNPQITFCISTLYMDHTFCSKFSTFLRFPARRMEPTC